MRTKENHGHEARSHTMTNCDQLLVQQAEVQAQHLFPKKKPIAGARLDW